MKASIRSLLENVSRPFRKFSIYAIYTTETVTSSYEDPHCPWDWRGSGCYDIDVYTLKARVSLVTARDASEARKVRERYLESEFESSKEFRMKSQKENCRAWWISDLHDELGTYMDIIEIRKTDIPVFSTDERKEFLDEIREDELMSSEREKNLEYYTPQKIVSAFRYDLKQWSIAHDKYEIQRLQKLIDNESSYLLRLLYSFRKEKCGRTRRSGRTAVKYLQRT